ncbi:MAG: oxygen-independent coproporphyrinogen III oxidase [Alphaproteobacteria bacterium]|nr:oxygen-independent coproporphyrinogen III oxidase [Alphaproteobacteria bacterium]
MEIDKKTLHLLQKYDRPAPRYTSFPTAAQFTHAVSQDSCLSFLKTLPEKESVSLYVHIPFCHSLCHYCGCNTKVVNTYAPVRAYLDLLHKEIDNAGQYVSGKPRAALLHFGGGSPNYLKPEDIKAVIEKLGEYFTFGAETAIDIESDPRYLDGDTIKAYADMGVSRVSLGIQDFDPVVQEAINRIQPFEQVKSCVEDLRANGIEKINFDLMTGLPLQTLESLARTVEQAVSLAPHRLSVFPYAHVPWMKKHQKLLEKYEMPGTQVRFAMTAFVDKTLQESGYTAIGIDHYARPDDSLTIAQNEDRLRRNFQGYTDDPCETVIGFGLSAISSYTQSYTQNTTDAPAYRAAVEKGEFPVARGCPLTDDDRARRRLIEKLMCDFELDLSAFRVLLETFPQTRSTLSLLAQDGIIELKNDHLTITEIGKPFTRIVASAFDPYFQGAEGRHARAV